MADERGPERAMGRCVECGSVYAARKKADGSLLPIGKRDGCECGGTEFVPVNAEPDDDDPDPDDR
ncbi:hypothetical protein [Halovivax sp.]|uniref:hypothetical protein n=1 Tax=Halovivax sp. TaxID=1935978 RepID=UPI0025B9EECB|nr:hypothetical protein [Halovivax sp.]